jgi:rod shape determining protein RodA
MGGMQFQPSEFGKIIFIVALSRFMTDYRDSLNSHQMIVSCIFLTLIPLAFIIIQPDYGTAVVYLLPILPMLYWANVNTKKIVLYIFPIISMLAQQNLIVFYIWMFLLTVILLFISKKIIHVIINFILNSSFGLLAPYAWKYGLREYHQDRILNLLNPGSDPLGVGYQILQSKVAIGSGGILGKGLGEGTQSYLRFLPIKDSDFILSVISEEMGFFCIAIITIIFLSFLYFNIDFSQRLFNRFQSLNIIGFCSLLFSHMIINMGMVVGLFPVIGLPFPFISYGGSFMITCFIIIGIMNNIVNNDL